MTDKRNEWKIHGRQNGINQDSIKDRFDTKKLKNERRIQNNNNNNNNNNN